MRSRRVRGLNLCRDRGDRLLLGRERLARGNQALQFDNELIRIVDAAPV